MSKRKVLLDTLFDILEPLTIFYALAMFYWWFFNKTVFWKWFFYGVGFVAIVVMIGIWRRRARFKNVKGYLSDRELLLNLRMMYPKEFEEYIADLLPEKLKRFPEDFKYYQNQYNSIRKHKLTLPIYFALYEWKHFDKKEFLKAVEEKNYNLITQIFLKEKIIKKCKTYIRKSMKGIESEFKFLPDSIWRSVLKVGVNAVNSNIFWKYFKKLYAEVA